MKKIAGALHTLVVIIVAITILNGTITQIKTQKRDASLHNKIDLALNKLDFDSTSLKTKGNYVTVQEANASITEATIQGWASTNNTQSSTLWSIGPYLNFTSTAPGVDYKHHIVNAYLEGYQPFKTENIWVPLYTLARHKKYQFDHLQHPGHPEVWQTSKQAYQFTRGDCEDHAIALADWLIEMGEDARVVTGKHKTGGHAWVVLFKDNQTLILEATDKNPTRRATDYPLANLKPNYHPEIMFNRTTFWYNTGSTYTTNYKNKNWVKKSTYTRIKT